MSAKGMMVTVLATGLAEAVLKDERPEEGGFDLSAGMFGRHVSDWIKGVAGDVEESRVSVQRLGHIAATTAKVMIAARKCNPAAFPPADPQEAAYVCHDDRVLSYSEMRNLLQAEALTRGVNEDRSTAINDDAVMRLADRCNGAQPEEVLRVIGDDNFMALLWFDPLSESGYRTIMASPDLQLEYQDALDSYFQGRIFDVRNNLRDQGWTGEMYAQSLASKCGNIVVKFVPVHVGAGRNVVAGKWVLSKFEREGFKSRQVELCSLEDNPAILAQNLAFAISTKSGEFSDDNSDQDKSGTPRPKG